MSGKTKQVAIFDLGFGSGKGEKGLLSKRKVIKKQDMEIIKCMESYGFLHIFEQQNKYDWKYYMLLSQTHWPCHP